MARIERRATLQKHSLQCTPPRGIHSSGGGHSAPRTGTQREYPQSDKARRWARTSRLGRQDADMEHPLPMANGLLHTLRISTQMGIFTLAEADKTAKCPHSHMSLNTHKMPRSQGKHRAAPLAGGLQSHTEALLGTSVVRYRVQSNYNAHSGHWAPACDTRDPQDHLRAHRNTC